MLAISYRHVGGDATTDTAVPQHRIGSDRTLAPLELALMIATAALSLVLTVGVLVAVAIVGM